MIAFKDRKEVEAGMDDLLEELESHDNDEALALRAYNAVVNKLGIRSFRRSFGKVLSVAGNVAAVLFIPLAVCLAVSLSSRDEECEWTEITVPAGQQRDLTLADGTSLTLNAGTRVTYPLSFDGKSRVLFLDGEIRADVAHDEKKPFIIHAGGVDLKVLGTKFDMKAYSLSQKVDVHLHEGSVMLHAVNALHSKSIQVSPGQHAQFDRSTQLFELENFDKELYHPFTNTSTLSFYKMQMHDITVELQRIFGREIVITDRQLAEKRVLAYFSNGESLEEILETLNIDGKMKIDMQDDVIYLSSK